MSFFLPNNLVDDLESLISFIRNTPSSEAFWKSNSSSRVLNASLNKVIIPSSKCKSKDFIVTLKTNKTKKATAPKKTLDKFNLILDDPQKGLPVKLAELQWMDPDLTLKSAINKIIEQNNREDISRQIDNNITIFNCDTLQLNDNENNAGEIISFYYVLKKLLIRKTESYESISSQILILEAMELELEIDRIKKEVILPLIKDTGSDRLQKVILLYFKITHNVQKSFLGGNKVYDEIDACLDGRLNQEEKITYQAFNWAYQQKKPGFFIFGENEMNLYNNVAKVVEKLNPIKDKYRMLFELIEKISDSDLKEQLHTKTDNYFIAQLSLETNGNKDKFLNVFKTFENESKALIKAHKEANKLNSEQLTFLYKILHVIAKAVPDFIAKRGNINNFFFKHTAEGKKITETENYIRSIAPAA